MFTFSPMSTNLCIMRAMLKLKQKGENVQWLQIVLVSNPLHSMQTLNSLGCTWNLAPAILLSIRRSGSGYGKLPIRITFPDRSAEALWLPTMLGEYYSWRRKPLEQKRSSTLT